MSPAAPAPAPRWAFGSRAQLAHALLLVVLLTAVFAALRGLAALVLGPDMGRDVPSVGFFAMLGLAVLVQAGAVVGLGLLRWGRLPLAELGWHSAHLSKSDVRGPRLARRAGRWRCGDGARPG